jgi:hypothetical protein
MIQHGEWLSNAAPVEELQDAADQMLEEKYGFFDEGGGQSNGPNAGTGPTPVGASYSVAAYEDSRRRFAAIDHWVEVLQKASGASRQAVLHHGERIAARWASTALRGQRADIARSAILAAEELRSRLLRERKK